MSNTPESEPTAERRTPPPNSVDVAHPLSAFVRGVLEIHFDGGAVVRRECAQFDARSFHDQQDGTQSSDEITWHALHWFQWDADKVAYAAFDADRDQNWKLEPDVRERLRAAGHEHGVIASLVRLWKERPSAEPTYSIDAIVMLHQWACDGVDRETWEDAARTLQGTGGAALLARARARLDEANEDSDGAANDLAADADTDDQADDGRAPESTPESAETPETSGDVEPADASAGGSPPTGDVGDAIEDQRMEPGEADHGARDDDGAPDDGTLGDE